LRIVGLEFDGAAQVIEGFLFLAEVEIDLAAVIEGSRVIGGEPDCGSVVLDRLAPFTLAFAPPAVRDELLCFGGGGSGGRTAQRRVDEARGTDKPIHPTTLSDCGHSCFAHKEGRRFRLPRHGGAAPEVASLRRRIARWVQRTARGCAALAGESACPTWTRRRLGVA